MSSEQPFDAGPRFEVRRELGAGGMGVVYEAFDRERQELVALKTLRTADEHWLTRFKREFRAIHDLAHPNLIALDELFDGASEPFFTMELIRGTDFLTYVRGRHSGEHEALIDSLADTVHRGVAAGQRGADEAAPLEEPARGAIAAPRRGFDEARLRSALRQLALGVSVLHAANKVHRDIKPPNIMVSAQGRVVLLDFGLLSNAVRPPSATDDGVVGTFAYMSPEQALENQVSPAGDWYSVGVVLFEALTGSLPHRGRSRYELILRKQKYEAAPPRQFVADVPPDLDALCIDLLQREPRDRPGVAEIFDRLGIADPQGLPAAVLSTGASILDPAYFIGRKPELTALRQAYERTTTSPLIFLIEGVPGVGKTHLVEHFLHRLSETEPETVVLAGRCYERELVSYKAFDGIAEALSRYLRQLPPARAAALMPRRAALVGRLFPVLRRVEAIASAPPVADLPDPHDQRRRMFDALRELFLRLCKGRRLVWYVDDLQWADADSLVLLQDLLVHEDPLPVFFIATMRPVDDERAALMARLKEFAPIEHHELGDFTPAEAGELVKLLMPGHDEASRETVAADAAGHPLFLLELARHAGQAPGAIVRGVSLDEIMAARIAQLGGGARRLLQVISVVAGPISQEVAALAAELSDAELVKAARLLRAANLARTDGVSKKDRIIVYHDRVREHVATGLDEDTLRHVHARLALALEQTGAAEREPRALVRHARAAGRFTLAAAYARNAAAHAASSLAFDQAADLYATAIELGAFDPETLRTLRIQQASALVDAGRGPEAAQLFMVAAEGAEPAVRLDCQRRAADQWIITGHIERGMEALRASLTDIGEPLASTPRAALARVAWNRLRLKVRGLGFQPRREGQVPVEQLRQLDVLKAVAHGLGMVDNVRGADFNSRFLLSALRTGVPERLVQALSTEVLYLTSQGGATGRRGRRVYEHLLKVSQGIGDEIMARTWLLLADGGACYLEGRFAAAVVALSEGESLVRQHTTGTTFLRNNTRVLRVHALRQLGSLRENDALIADGIRSGRQRGDRYLETSLRFLRGTVLLARDRADEARDGLASATWSPPESGYHMQHWSELRTRTEIALYEGTAAAAIHGLQGQFAQLRRSMVLRIQIIRSEALSVRGRLLLAATHAGSSDEKTKARAEVAALANRLERAGVGYARVYGLLLRAGLSGRSREETVTILRRAVAEADEQGMALHLAAARHYLGQLLAGDEGAALVGAAAAYAAREGIRRPERLFAVFVPGLADG